MEKEIWVICEIAGGKTSKASFELMSKAYGLSQKMNSIVTAVVVPSVAKEEMHCLGEYGANKVCSYSGDTSSYGYKDDVKAEIISHYAKLIKPEIIIMPATLHGRSLAPRIAMKLETGLTADCIELDIDENGLLTQTRPAYGGNIVAEIVCEKKRPQMATVRPGVFPCEKPDMESCCEPVLAKWNFFPHGNNRIRLIELVEEKKEAIPIESVEVIVSGGAGVGSEEGFKKLELLANLLGGTSAASRAAVNAGYAPYKKQVGQTGKTIRPKLYIACGISGAVQHLAGMSSSDYIIAINSDPKAPIFDICDYGIVGKIDDIIDALIEHFSKKPMEQNHKGAIK